MDGSAARLQGMGRASRPGPLTSSFERAAGWSERRPARQWDAAGILLAATTANLQHASAGWRPIWADEAMHRAYATLRLFATLPPSHPGTSLWLNDLHHRLAVRIAERLGEFDEADDGRLVPCSTLLRDLVHGLVALFGPSTGQISIRTDIQRLALSRDRRRALTLLAWELVTNALLHAFDGQRHGLIDVRLHTGLDGALLQVSDDGVGLRQIVPGARCSVSNGLATILGSNLRYRRECGQTIVNVGFTRFHK